MKRYITLLLFFGVGTAAYAVPVVPNFTQGTMNTQTETSSTVTEIINSVDYRTGWEYTVSGTGISNNGEALNPGTNASTISISPSAGSTGSADGAAGQMVSSFDSLDLNNMGDFTITNPGQGFQFTQSYSGPGMTNQTIIQRVTVVESLQSTTSVFSN